jgi:hypothetical protein
MAGLAATASGRALLKCGMAGLAATAGWPLILLFRTKQRDRQCLNGQKPLWRACPTCPHLMREGYNSMMMKIYNIIM